MAKKGVELASAYISLNVSTDNVPRQVRDALRGVRDVEIDVDARTSGASANMSRWRAGEERRPVNVKVDVDTKGASRQVGVLRRDLEALRRSDFLKLNLGAAGISSLPALATGLAEVAAGLQQVSQAALAIPGGIAGAVSSIGTLAFGLTGVADAYDAVTKASEDAATSGADQASQARAAMSASNNLRNAIVDEAQARKDVARATRDARNELMDLNVEMRGGLISEKRAVLEAQKAREELASGNFTDIRDQMLRVEEADQRLIETRARNAQRSEELADANAKGVAGSDQVVAANERLVRSQQGVDEAQAAVAASAPKASAAQEKAAEAMAQLHPEAQALITTLREIATGPGLELRNLVQGNVLRGVSGQLSAISGKVLPRLEKGLGGIGDAWNENIMESFRVLGEEDNLSLLERIFGNTEEAQSILTKSIDPLVEAIGTLSGTGTDFLPRMAEGFVAVSERFNDFITEADKDGRLEKWIDDGITGLADLGEAALNVGKMFTGITGATDGNFLTWLRDVTDQWQEWINSAEGQTAIRDFFEEGRDIFQRWKPILEDIPGLLKGIFDAASLYMGGLLKVLDPFTTFLSEHPKLVETAALAYLAFSGARTLAAIATLSTKLKGIGGDLDVLPTKAGKAARGINAAFALIVVPAIGELLNDEIDKFLEENFPGINDLNHTNTPDQLGKRLRDWMDNKFTQQQLDQAPPASGPDALSPDFFLGPSTQGGGNTAGQLFGGAMGGSNGSATARIAPGSYGLPGNTDTGGYGTGSSKTFPPWVMQIADAFGIKPSTYAGHQTTNRQEPGYAPNPQGLNRGVDWSGPPANMQRFADYLATIPGNLEQVIWNGAGVGTGRTVEIAGGRSQPGYFSSDLAGHGNHVHTRQSMPIPLPPWLNAGTFDQGGWLPPGMTLTHNQTGQPELILNPEQIQNLTQSGIDPNTLLHGTGAFPGPTGVDPSIEQQFGFGSQPGDMAGMSGRTEGYIPAGAGYSGKTGGGVAGSLIALGGEAAKGAIQMAADLGKMAASAAAAGATGGGGAAAGPAAGAGIQIAADIAKRGVDWGVDMANIGIGALSEILMPFGAPRWLSDVDATSFMPQMGIQSAATTSVEQMAQQQLQNQLTPQQIAGQAPPMPLAGQHMPPGAQPGVPVPPGPTGVPPGQSPGGQPNQPPPPAQPQQQDPSTMGVDFLKSFGIFDSGGVLQPNSGAVNLSNRPEYVFTQSQFAAMGANAANAPAGETNYYVQGVDLNEALRELKKTERRNSGPRMRGKAGIG